MRPAMSLGAALLLLAACGQSDGNSEASSTPLPLAAPVMDEPATGAANAMSPEAIAAKLVGTFVYADDDKSTITVTSDGEWTEAYDGSGTTTAEWRVFAGSDAPADTGETFAPASRYLELIGDAGTFYYELGMISDEGFDMFHVGRGNQLNYVRMKVPA